MITFIEHNIYGYAARTIENAILADCTIAFAFDFNTPGEKLTKRATLNAGRLYFPVHYLKLNHSRIADEICEIVSERFSSITINVAGNGAYTQIKYGITQDRCDLHILRFFQYLLSCPALKTKEISIRSGGQSGADEAGLKAAVKLGIPAICLAPFKWKFIDANGTHHSDELLFKKRFEF